MSETLAELIDDFAIRCAQVGQAPPVEIVFPKDTLDKFYFDTFGPGHKPKETTTRIQTAVTVVTISER